MTLHTFNQQQPARASDANANREAAIQVEPGTRANPPMSRPTEEAARSVMHPDHHDPDWRYYFGAMAG